MNGIIRNSTKERSTCCAQQEVDLMRWKDLPIRKRLLAANYLMILMPVLCFALLSLGIFWIFGLENLNRSSIISFIWPESGPTLVIQFELTRLRVRSDHYDPEKPKPLLLVSDHLEDQGLRVVLEQNGTPFYVTPGQQAEEIRLSTLQQVPEGRGSVSWGKKGVAFHYRSLRTGVESYVVGADPLVETDDRFSMHSKELFKSSFIGAFLLVLLTAALTGLALSRLMARQLLKPLGKLRVAAQVSRGDLDIPIRADSRDEIGDTLRAFEKSRLELCRARQKREQDERSRKEMLAGIAHDLATPLTKIQGYAAGIQDGIADTPESGSAISRRSWKPRRTWPN